LFSPSYRDLRLQPPVTLCGAVRQRDFVTSQDAVWKAAPGLRAGIGHLTGRHGVVAETTPVA